MEKVKTRRTRSYTLREIAERERRTKEHEEEIRKDQKRLESINRREKAKKFGRTMKKKVKPRGLPKNLQIGDCVLIKQGIGIVRYVGFVPGSKKKDQVYAGIELKESHAKGLNDGSAFGIRHFKCEDKRGVFVRHIQKVLQPESLLLQLGKLNADLKQAKIVQMKHQDEIANLRLENEDLLRKFEAEKEKAKLVEIECYKQSNADVPTLPMRLSNPSGSQYEDDEKLPTSTDDMKINNSIACNQQRKSVLTSDRNSHDDEERKKKALFRVSSSHVWSENDVMDYERELQKELVKGQREQALIALDLPDFNAPDGDFIKWLSQRFQQFTKLESQFKVPDIKDAKVKRALLVVARMLASFTQQISRREAMYRIKAESLLSSVNSGDDEEDFTTSSEYSTEEDF